MNFTPARYRYFMCPGFSVHFRHDTKTGVTDEYLGAYRTTRIKLQTLIKSYKEVSSDEIERIFGVKE